MAKVKRILNGRDLAHRDGHTNLKSWIAARCQAMASRRLLDTPWTGEIDLDAAPVQARIDYGRWIADCPDCGGAEYVDHHDKIFYCFSCGNASIGGAGRAVEFPANRQEIEDEILLRDVDDRTGTNDLTRALQAKPTAPGLARSWRPGETVDDLREQRGRRHGV